MSRLPVPGSDSGTWGTILNDYLAQAHQADGTLKPITLSKISDAGNVASRNIGTTSGTVAAGDDTRITSAPALGVSIPYADVGGNTKAPMIPGVIGLGAQNITSLTANAITYHPMYLNRPMTLDEMWLEITTQQVSSHVKVAVYTADADMQPGALIKDCGIADSSSTGIKKLTGLNTPMAAGVYLMARITDVTSVGIRYVPTQYAMGSLVNPALGSTPWGQMTKAAGIYATFPLDPGTPWDSLVGAGTSSMALTTYPVWSA